MRTQKIYLSQTQSGITGWFTAGWLVWPLDPYRVPQTKEEAEAHARRAGFELDEPWDRRTQP